MGPTKLWGPKQMFHLIMLKAGPALKLCNSSPPTVLISNLRPRLCSLRSVFTVFNGRLCHCSIRAAEEPPRRLHPSQPDLAVKLRESPPPSFSTISSPPIYSTAPSSPLIHTAKLCNSVISKIHKPPSASPPLHTAKLCNSSSPPILRPRISSPPRLVPPSEIHSSHRLLPPFSIAGNLQAPPGNARKNRPGRKTHDPVPRVLTRVLSLPITE